MSSTVESGHRTVNSMGCTVETEQRARGRCTVTWRMLYSRQERMYNVQEQPLLCSELSWNSAL